ncbi:uncharacterized membrane protein YjfL (UPF0719 family) [Paenibacillus sp. DS2015]
MLLISLIIIGFLFSLIAVFRNRNERYLGNIAQSITIFSILFCLLKINQSTADLTSVNTMVIISTISYVIYQFSQTDIRWK